MRAAGPPFESQVPMWMLAFALSALLNVLILLVVGFLVLRSIEKRPVSTSPKKSAETIALIVPQIESVTPVADPKEKVESPSFVRTSPDQADSAPISPDFIGERNTEAASDRMTFDSDRDLPNQTGEESEEDLVESQYQDGDLSSTEVSQIESPQTPPDPTRVAESTPNLADPSRRSDGTEDATSEEPQTTVAKDQLAEGPIPVDRLIEGEVPEVSTEPTPVQRKSEGELEEGKNDTLQEKPQRESSERPAGFRGYQKNAPLTGSLNRVGKSALNVEESVLGRYHSAVSRAVEKEWQRNCVRNREFIVPGQLTLSFVLDSAGKVRSKLIVDDFGVGNIQKGFTLNSIRDAEIPEMPKELKEQLDGESLELMYRFNF